VSHVAIAAALALSDVSAGERMAAFSLASFANREHRAWPGTRVAAARAGLSRSQYFSPHATGSCGAGWWWSSTREMGVGTRRWSR
jgi:hypothetical protein